MLTRPTRAVLVAVLLCAGSLPAAAQTDGGLFGNIFKPPAPANTAPQGPDPSELVMRIERLENALRNLTGQVEQLQYRNQQLESQLQRLGGAAGAETRAPAPGPAATGTAGGRSPAPAPAAPGGGKRSDAFDPNADPAAPGAPQVLGSPSSGSAGLAGRQTGPQVASLPGGGGARELYDAGAGQMQRQDYAGAEQTFRQIIQAHAGDRVVPDATFMLGESLFLRQNFSDAAAAFLEVSTKYPNSTRAPEALLRLGQSLTGLGEKETACATFLEVDRKYPRTASSIRQAVEREQKRVGC